MAWAATADEPGLPLLADQSRRWPPGPGSISRSISSARRSPSSRRRASGAQAFRSPSRPCLRRPGCRARTVGRVYAANTVGAIAGALLFSLLVDLRGGNPERAALADGDCRRGSPADAAGGRRQPTPRRFPAVRRLAGAVVRPRARRSPQAASVAPVPPALIAYGRQIASPTSQAAKLSLRRARGSTRRSPSRSWKAASATST